MARQIKMTKIATYRGPSVLRARFGTQSVTVYRASYVGTPGRVVQVQGVGATPEARRVHARRDAGRLLRKAHA